MPRSHKPYPPELKKRLVELVRAGRNPEELAEKFEPTAQAIRNWVQQADLDDGRRQDGLTTEEREELRRLRRENKVLREEREILKKAAVGSMGRCNIFCFASRPGGHAHGTDGTAWALRGEEAGTLAAMEGWSVAE